MYNYPTKFDLKGPIDIEISEFAKKTDLASLKSDADQLDIDKLKTVDLTELSNVVKYGVVKKAKYDELVENDIQTNDTS